MQGEQAINRADDRDDVQGFDNLQTEAEIAEYEAWLDEAEANIPPCEKCQAKEHGADECPY